MRDLRDEVYNAAIRWRKTQLAFQQLTRRSGLTQTWSGLSIEDWHNNANLKALLDEAIALENRNAKGNADDNDRRGDDYLRWTQGTLPFDE